MKSLETVLAVGTILPTLLVATAQFAVAAPSVGETAPTPRVETPRLAQAATPEELRRTNAGKKEAPGRPPATGPVKAGEPRQTVPGAAVPETRRPPAAAPTGADRAGKTGAGPMRPDAARPSAPAVGHPVAPTAPVAPSVKAPGAAPAVARPQAPGKPGVPAAGTAVPVAPAPGTAAPRPTAPNSAAPAPAAPVLSAPATATPPGAPRPAAASPTAVPTAPRPGAAPGVMPPPAGSVGAPPSGTAPGEPPRPPQGAGGFVPPQGAAVPPTGPGRPVPPPPAPRSEGGPGVGAVLGAAAAGVAVGVVGGMMLGGDAHALDDVHRQRRETVRDGATFYAEPGRVIVRDDQGLHLRHDETERFRDFGGTINEERRGDEVIRVWDRPDGVRIVTVTDPDGRLIRRVRRWPDGREEVLIDDAFRPRPRSYREEVVVLPPPPVPVERRFVDAEGADETVIYDTLRAAPFAPLPRRYTLSEVRASRDLRGYMGAVDVDTINFDTGSWTVDQSQVSRLDHIARSISRILANSPDEIFLVEGHTDAVGSDVDNLSLSDRRAQSVAAILTRDFRIPAENLVTQGYGETELKEQTSGPSRVNRRVSVRRITPLLGAAGK